MNKSFFNQPKHLIFVVVALIAAPLWMAGCSSGDSNSAQPSIATQIGTGTHTDSKPSPELEEIQRRRENDGVSPDYAIGPGDVLEISVPDMPELKDREVRVSANDTIALPVLGSISIKEMTEEEVRDTLKQRLSKYMRDPQVDVFVKQYRSRMVAVEGMVQKPGLYSLTDRSDTVLDMVSRAGGMLENASTRVIFIPSDPHHSSGRPTSSQPVANMPPNPSDGQATQTSVGPEAPEHTVRVSAEVGGGTTGEHFAPVSYSKQGTPIVIDLTQVSHQSNLDVPVRPGDVIIVPAAGQVMVKGWVQNPGAFRIVPGMTVLGAVSAAGGEMFSSSARILRNSDAGQKVEIPVDLSKVQSGEESDVIVESGDVVIVDKSVAGAVPYAAYEIFTKFSTGVPIVW